MWTASTRIWPTSGCSLMRTGDEDGDGTRMAAPAAATATGRTRAWRRWSTSAPAAKTKFNLADFDFEEITSAPSATSLSSPRARMKTRMRMKASAARKLNRSGVTDCPGSCWGLPLLGNAVFLIMRQTAPEKAPSPAKVLALALIIRGTLLLMLPIATRDRRGLAPLEALFTATSATCVTGLWRWTATRWAFRPGGHAVPAAGGGIGS